MVTAAAVAGAAGGLVLGLAVFLMNLVENLRSQTPDLRTGQLVLTHVGVTVLLAGIGGVCAHFLTGQAGDFLQGVTAVGFLLLLAGGALTGIHGDRHARTADSAQ